MKIISKYITPNKFSRPEVKLDKVKAIVLHWLASPNGTGHGVYNWFESRKTGEHGYGSAHFCIETGGDIYQFIPQEEMAYHVGSETYTDFGLSLSEYPNDCTIGIELSHINWEGEFTEETWKSAVKLTYYLLKTYNLNPEDITTHQAIVGWKDCPRWMVKHPEELERFKGDVRKLFDSGSIETATAAVNIRTAPGEQILHVLKYGEQIPVVGIEDGYNIVQLGSERQGYVYGNYLT